MGIINFTVRKGLFFAMTVLVATLSFCLAERNDITMLGLLFSIFSLALNLVEQDDLMMSLSWPLVILTEWTILTSIFGMYAMIIAAIVATMIHAYSSFLTALLLKADRQVCKRFFKSIIFIGIACTYVVSLFLCAYV